MSGPRGYSSYRGREPRGRLVLAIILCAVILIAVAAIILQSFVVYDGNGKPHFSFLEKKPAVEDTAPLDDELEIIAPPPPAEPEPPAPELVPATAQCLAAAPLTMESWSAFLASGPECDVALVPMKEGSRVFFPSITAVPGAVQTAEDTADAITALQAGSRKSAARIGCFHDSGAANADVEGMGLKNTGKYIFYDGKNTQWLDPAKPAARAYLCSIAAEAAKLGFDEIVLSEVSYPTEGKLNKIAYGDTPIAENIGVFLTEMRAALAPFDVRLGVELAPEVLLTGADEVAGVELERILPHVDRIYTAGTEAEREALSARLPDGVALVLEPPAAD